MPEHVVQSSHGDDGSGGQSMHSYQSVWMAHWMRTSCNTTPQVHNFLPTHLENKGNNYNVERQHFLSGLEIASDTSTCAKSFRETTEARTVQIMNETQTKRPKDLINQRSDCQPFPIFNLGQSSWSSLAPNNDQDTSCHRVAVRPRTDHHSKHNNRGTSYFPSALTVGPPATEATSREFYFKCEGISWKPEGQANTHELLGDSSLGVARPSPGSSFMCRQLDGNHLTYGLASRGDFSNANYTILEHEQCNYRSHSSVLFCEKTTDNHSNTGKSKTSFLRQNTSLMSLQHPSTSKSHLALLGGEQYQKMLNCSRIGFFPSHGSLPVETTRMCIPANSVEGEPGDPPKFSKPKHNYLITETKVNLSKENRMARESRVSTKFSELITLSQVFGQHQRVKVQPPASSTDGEGTKHKKKVETSEVCIKNESSTETDTMDMDAFKDDHHSGDNSCPLNKAIEVGPDQLSQATIASTRVEVGSKRPIVMLPDINEELAALPAAASSMDNEEPSSTRTQSLDAEHLLAHAPLAGRPLGPEASSRWIKRLKPIASNSFAIGTKSSHPGEALSHEKAKKFSEIMKGNTSISEKILGKCHDKELLDQAATVSRNVDSSSMNKSKADRDITLSHFWIQRWCHNRAANVRKKPAAVAVCEPQTSKVPFDEYQKKQFPSIASMALMGKVMSGFQPCELQDRGSFMVWK